jgi:hypothetical protein
MKALTLLIFVLLSGGFAYSQTNCDRYKDGYIPKNLNDALNYLDCKWSASDKEKFRQIDERDVLATLHFGTGAAIRNSWGLWKKKKTSLRKSFNKMGIYHPDDISGIIFTSFHRTLNNKPIDLDKQVEFYKVYWAKHKVMSDSMAPINNVKWAKKLETYSIGDTVKIRFRVSGQGKKVWFDRPILFSNDSSDCYITGIVKRKRGMVKGRGDFALSLYLIDLGGYKEALYNSRKVIFKIGKTYDIFSLGGFEISKV